MELSGGFSRQYLLGMRAGNLCHIPIAHKAHCVAKREEVAHIPLSRASGMLVLDCETWVKSPEIAKISGRLSRLVQEHIRYCS